MPLAGLTLSFGRSLRTSVSPQTHPYRAKGVGMCACSFCYHVSCQRVSSVLRRAGTLEWEKREALSHGLEPLFW